MAFVELSHTVEDGLVVTDQSSDEINVRLRGSRAALRNLDTDEVYIDLIDEMSPGVIKNQSSFLYVLMPMRV